MLVKENNALLWVLKETLDAYICLTYNFLLSWITSGQF